MSEFKTEEELDQYSKEWLDGYDEGFDDGWNRRGETGDWVRQALIFAGSGAIAGAAITALFILIGG